MVFRSRVPLKVATYLGLGAVIYILSFAIFVKSVTVEYAHRMPPATPSAFLFVSCGSTVNRIGYWAYWPIHRSVTTWSGGKIVFTTDDGILALHRRK